MPTTNQEAFYVLRHLNGTYVDQDMNSGGYPYLVDGFRRAFMFDSFEDAFNYKGIFSRNQFDSDKWRIVRCDIAQRVISMSTYLSEKEFRHE